MSTFTMTQAEREAFLAGTHVGVLAVDDPGRPPLAVPVWYSYEPGGLLTVITGRESRKLALIRRQMTFTLCAQSETSPYAYVTVSGPVVAIEPVDPAERRAMAHRYLGPERGDRYLTATAERDEEDVAVRLRPERWFTTDYAKGRRR